MFSSSTTDNNLHHLTILLDPPPPTMMPYKNSVDNVDIDSDFDLRRNYQTAVECLIECESIIASFQDQLVSKDEQIGTLEDKIVQMSLELASSKAFEDTHRSTKRDLTIAPQDQDDGDDLITVYDNQDDESSPQDQPDNKKRQQRRERRCSWSLSLRRERSLSLSLGSDSCPSAAPTLDESSTSITSRNCNRRASHAIWPAVDESSSSRLSTFDFGQFFRKKEETPKDLVVANDNEKQCTEQQDDPTDANNRRTRRPPNKRRLERMKSSLVLSGVVFPKSFDDVVCKGLCLALGDSLKCMASEQEKLGMELGYK